MISSKVYIIIGLVSNSFVKGNGDGSKINIHVYTSIITYTMASNGVRGHAATNKVTYPKTIAISEYP